MRRNRWTKWPDELDRGCRSMDQPEDPPPSAPAVGDEIRPLSHAKTGVDSSLAASSCTPWWKLPYTTCRIHYVRLIQSLARTDTPARLTVRAALATAWAMLMLSAAVGLGNWLWLSRQPQEVVDRLTLIPAVVCCAILCAVIAFVSLGVSYDALTNRKRSRVRLRMVLFGPAIVVSGLSVAVFFLLAVSPILVWMWGSTEEGMKAVSEGEMRDSPGLSRGGPAGLIGVALMVLVSLLLLLPIVAAVFSPTIDLLRGIDDEA